MNSKISKAAFDRSLKKSEQAKNLGEEAKKASMTESKTELEELVNPEIQKLSTFLDGFKKKVISEFLGDLKSKIIVDFKDKLKQESYGNYDKLVETYISGKLKDAPCKTHIENRFSSIKPYTQESLEKLKEEISQEIISSNIEDFKTLVDQKIKDEAEAQAQRKIQAERKAIISNKIIEKFKEFLDSAELVQYKEYVNKYVNEKLMKKIDTNKIQVEDLDLIINKILDDNISNLFKYGNGFIRDSQPPNSGSAIRSRQISYTPLLTIIKGLENPSSICYFNALLSSLFHLPIIRNLTIQQLNLETLNELPESLRESYSEFYKGFIEFKNQYILPSEGNKVNLISKMLIKLAYNCLEAYNQISHENDKIRFEQDSVKIKELKLEIDIKGLDPEKTEYLKKLQERGTPDQLLAKRKNIYAGMFKENPENSDFFSQEDTNLALLTILDFTDRSQTLGLNKFFRFRKIEKRYCINIANTTKERTLQDLRFEWKPSPFDKSYKDINFQNLQEKDSGTEWKYNDDNQELQCDWESKTIIPEWPQILYIAVTRGDSHGAQNKINSPINFDLEFKNNVGDEFKLYAVILHIGININSGHYVSRVLINDKWYECSDRDITEVKNPYPSNSAREGTIVALFYQKIN